MWMKSIIDVLEGKNKLIMMHRSADPDALGSAYVISRIFGGDIDITGGINRTARKMLEMFDIKGVENPDFRNYDEIIVLDAASPHQIHAIPPEISLVIDHHLDAGEWEIAEHRLIDERAISCTQIIGKLLKRLEIEVDERSALAVLIGMYTDSRGLSMGNPDFMREFADMMEIARTNIGTLRDFLQTGNNNSVKTAIMKGLQRLKFRAQGEIIIAWTHVSMFESAMANAMVCAGADIAFVGSEKNGEIRIIGRASDRVLEKGFHLGRFFSSLGYEIDGEGGGHDGAAGFGTVGDVENILMICVTRAMAEIK